MRKLNSDFRTLIIRHVLLVVTKYMSARKRGRPRKKPINMANITMSDEQFQLLLERIQSVNREVTSPQLNDSSDAGKSGNFVKCTSRYDGEKSSDVESFISAVEVYVDCANVSEENALKGLPMLLTGEAATWWLGVKDQNRSWPEAIEALRAAFGRKKAAFQIYKELFQMEQDFTTPTDLFVSRARALLSEIPDNLPEKVKLDMVYGLLNKRIRKRIPRESVTTFKDLLTQSRVVEQSLEEYETNRGDKGTGKKEHQKDKPKKRCNYCRTPGHEIENCPVLLKRKEKPNNDTNCKPKSTAVDKSNVACYGCGAPGIIKSNCPTCKTTVRTESAHFYTAHTSNFRETDRPMIPIQIFELDGLATLDTGANRSIMGRNLYRLLRNRCVFEPTTIMLTLADGGTTETKVLVSEVTIKVKHKSVKINMVVLPFDKDNHTLLGTDAIAQLGIVVNIAEQTWYFTDSQEDKYSFNTIMDPSITKQMAAKLEEYPTWLLRPDEGQALSENQRKMLNGFLQEHEGIFAQGGDATPFAEHCIDVGDHSPIYVPPYKVPANKKPLLKAELERLLEENIIEECESPWGAPTVLVPKKDGGIRVCVDYRRLNAITKSDSYPMSRIDELLQEAKRTPYMTTLDLRSGYHQVSVKESDRDKTCFVTPFGTYRFLRMPFGLKNAPASFQRLMDRFKSGLPNVLVLAYLDDLIVLSESFEKHLSDLEAVFKRLQLFKLRVNRVKCNFACTTVKYLGHLITPDGLKTDPAKVSAILEMKPPRTLKHLQSFLQTCSWYRKFIPNFSQVAQPLTMLTRRKQVWCWKDKQEEAFRKLKELLTSAPILQQSDPNKPYILRTDASSYALGAALLQKDGDSEKPIEYASRLLLPAERNYSTTEREALAVVWATDKFRGYLDGSEIIIGTDHQPLKWLLTLKSPTGRLARWFLKMQSYNFNIVYTPGKENIIADTLSRPPCTYENENQCDICVAIVDMPRETEKTLREEQLKDPDISKIVTVLETTPQSDDVYHWRDRGYILNDGVLYRYSPEFESEEAQYVVPAQERETILKNYHDLPTAGHYGVEGTLNKIAQKYYWPNMRKYVAEYVKKCVPCQKYKATNLKPAGLLQTPVQAQRFEVMAIDLFGPLPTSEQGNRWILIVEDTATKWVELFALPDATASACAKALIEEVIFRYGVPRRLISDNGVQFVSAIMQHVCDAFAIEQALIPFYHAEANPVERKNRDLKPRLAILVGNMHQKWDDFLSAIRYAMNTTVTQSTGYTPAFLTFGRELRNVQEVVHDLRSVIEHGNFVQQMTPYLKKLEVHLNSAREKAEQEQLRQKNYADKHRRPAPAYEPGDLVLVKAHVLSNAEKGFSAKLAPKRDGPYRILRATSATSYEISDLESPNVPLGKYHTSQLTPFVGGFSSEVQPVVPKRKRGRPRKQP